jgi:hypothetical protein
MLIPFGILSAAAGVAPIIRVGVAGYVAGGFQTAINKFAYPSDTRSVLSATMTSNVNAMSGFANSAVAGYFAGGFISTPTTQTTRADKIAFPSDTKSTLNSALSSQRSDLSGASNWDVAGYSFGGFENGFSTIVTTVDKLAFPAETNSTLGTGLSSASQGNASLGNQTVAAYSAGGSNSGGRRDTVDKFAFPGDARSTLGTGLSSAREQPAGMADSGTAGYFGGGSTTVVVSTVDKFAFPSDTRSTLGTGLSSARGRLAGFANRGVAGYFAGGTTGSNVTTVDKFEFPSDTRSTLGTGLSVAISTIAGMADEG